MINISPCRKNDYTTLIQIEKSTFQDHSFENEFKILGKQNSHVIWKIEEKKIIGFVSFFHVKDEIEIIDICIIKSYQRKNYGSILINEIKKLNIKKIFLEVSVENVNAINFYIKNIIIFHIKYFFIINFNKNIYKYIIYSFYIK